MDPQVSGRLMPGGSSSPRVRALQSFQSTLSELWFPVDLIYFLSLFFFLDYFWAVNYGLSVCETLQYNSGIVVLFTV